MKHSNIRRSFSLVQRFGAVVVLLLILVPLGVGVAPKKVEAVVFVDPVNLVQNTIQAVISNALNIKEYILDPLAHMVARMAIQSLMRSIITWANNGFEGSPAFVTDLRENLQGLADRVADTFLDELGVSGVINSPFRDVLVRELRSSYRRITSDNAFFETNRYDLDQYSDNPDALLAGDLSQGGIEAWIHTWMNPQNNPFGAFIIARKELEGRVASAVGERRTELEWSRGILSWCGGESSSGGPLDLTTPTNPDRRDPVNLRNPNVGCEPGQQRRTPGSFIHARIERALDADIDSLVSADEIDEVIGALLQGLINKMLGGSGFLGLSEAPSGGGRSPLEEATDPSAAAPQEGNSLAGAIDGQIQSLTEYQSHWERIRSAIDRARTVCETSGANGGMLTEVNTASSQASGALSDVPMLIGELREIQSKVSATGTGASQRISEGTQQYQALLASGRLPTVTEITYAARESQETEATETPTLLMRMNEIVANRCR